MADVEKRPREEQPPLRSDGRRVRVVGYASVDDLAEGAVRERPVAIALDMVLVEAAGGGA
jgi:hypothetical protein